MIEQEIWKPIKGYEGLYDVSNYGRIRRRERESIRRFDGRISIIKERIIKGGKSGSYRSVSLWKDYHPKTYLVHRLVAEAFLYREEGQSYINHLDNDSLNNCADNLEWCTQSHNVQYAYDNGRKEGPHKRDVDQLSLNGEYIRTWHGITPAGRTLGISYQNIWKVCNNRREQAGGYKWRYTQ